MDLKTTNRFCCTQQCTGGNLKYMTKITINLNNITYDAVQSGLYFSVTIQIFAPATQAKWKFISSIICGTVKYAEIVIPTLQSVYDILNSDSWNNTHQLLCCGCWLLLCLCFHKPKHSWEKGGNSSLPRTFQFPRGYPQATQAQLTCTLASLDENTSIDVDIT